MLKSIHLINFQSHKDSSIDLSNGINVLCGESDHGKSSFIRAFWWVVENRPSGDGYRTKINGEVSSKDTVVRIEFDNGWVERRKGKSINSYTLFTSETGELEFKAMKSGVPQQILDFLKLRSINFQFQMDSPFLLASSSSEVAQYLNKEARLDIIDIASSNIRRKILQNSSNLKKSKTDLDELKKSLLQYEGLDLIEEKMKRAEQVQLSLNKNTQSLSSLSALAESRKEKEQKFQKWDAIVKKLIPIEKQANKTYLEIKQKRDQFVSLRALAHKVSLNRIELQKHKAILRHKDQFQKLETLFDKWKSGQVQIKELQSLNQKLIKQQKEIEILSKKEEEAHESYKKASRNICPTCGQRRGKGVLLPLS